MMAADILAILVKTNFAAAAAILLALVLRRPVRNAFGARVAYALWLMVPLAVGASLAPARTVAVPYTAPAFEPAVEPAAAFAASGVSGLADAAPLINDAALVALWLVGVAFSLGLLAWSQSRFMKGLGGIAPEGRFLRATAPAAGPAVVGVFFPRIVLPADFETRYEPAEQTVVLAHEAAHLASGDAVINALMAAGQSLFWFNPLIHIAARTARVDQELACDAAVLSAYPQMRRAYGEALLKTQIAAAPLPLGCYWPAGASNPLKERIAMLKLETPPPARTLAGGATVLALCLGAGAAAWAAQPATVTLVEAPFAARSASVTAQPERAFAHAAAVAQAVASPTAQPAAPRPSPAATSAEVILSPAGNSYRRYHAPPIVGGNYALRATLPDGTAKTFLVPRMAPLASAADETEAYHSAKDTFDAALDEQAARAARNAPAQPLTPELQSAIQVITDFTKDTTAKRMAEIDAKYDRITVALNETTTAEGTLTGGYSITMLVPKTLTRAAKAATLRSVDTQLALRQPEAARELRLKAREILDARPTID